MEITRDAVKLLREEINDALKTLGEKHGVTIAARNATFEPTKATFKLEVTGSAPDGKSHDQVEWARHAMSFGLEAEWFGEEFAIGAVRYQIVGLTPRARKYPVLARKLGTGTVYKLPSYRVRHAITNNGK